MENNQMDIYLVAIKQAFESGQYSRADSTALRSWFIYAWLYRSLIINGLGEDHGVMAGIDKFKKMIELELQPPDVEGNLTLELADNVIFKETVALNLCEEKKQQADAIYRAVLGKVIFLFQSAIIQITEKMLNNASLTVGGLEDAKYVIGMSEITATNLNRLRLETEDLDQTSFNRVKCFIVDAARFAGKLRSEEFGIVAN